jgi:prepilin-type N-terminal cleavage/methylation domain-containing protein
MVRGTLSADPDACMTAGFTLVEVMVVVLVIGILVSMAIPVYTESRLVAQAKSCQANQRVISGAVELMRADGADTSGASDGVLVSGGSGWYEILVAPVSGAPWIHSAPTCPEDDAGYYMTAAGAITGDNGATDPSHFRLDHAAP